nr:MAG TPA: hypothetical protein [Caudoviricetes sp.]
MQDFLTDTYYIMTNVGSQHKNKSTLSDALKILYSIVI